MQLSPDEFKQHQKWFWNLDDRPWDEELEKDIADGKLEEIGREAIADFEAGNYLVK